MSTFITKNQGGKSKPKTSSSSSSSTKKTTTTAKSTAKPIDYTFDSRKETAEQYNARIAKERGDSAKELESMQKVTAETFKKSGLSATSIPKATVPTNVANIPTPVGPVKMPTDTPAMGDITDATAGMAGLSEYTKLTQAAIKAEAERAEKAAREQEQKQKTLLEKWFGTDGEDLTSPMEAREQAWDETGMDAQDFFAEQEAGFKEIEKLTKDYDAVVLAKDTQIAQAHDNMGSNDFINNQIAQIERNAAPKLNSISAHINSKAATLQALQGNFAEAQRYVNQAVQDATADTKFKYDMFKTFYEINENTFERTDKIYSDAYKTSLALAEADYNRQYNEKTQIAEWLIKYPNAGIRIGDSLDEAARKASTVSGRTTVDLTADMRNYEYAVADGYEGSFADFIGKGNSSTSANYTDVMQQAIDEGATPEAAARAAALVSERDGIPVDQATLNSWTAVARNLKKTPPPPTILKGNNSVSSYGNINDSLYESLFR